MKTMQMTNQVIESSEKLRWVPAFAKQRLVDWAQSLDWDWVVSRQRVFGTPIPVWYCKDCSEVLLADENKLPSDPRRDPPPRDTCPKCGSHELKGESDVLDTWMDSSISAAVHAGWPASQDLFHRLFPADLQPNGLDIVRTWDYYLMVRGLALFSKPPYKTLLINGMVRGTDGRMMHKSYGNFVESSEVMKKLGADAFRQWAASGGSTGYDIPFRWNDAEHGKKFLTKLWNVARFISSYSTADLEEPKTASLSIIDQWLLGSLQELIVNVTEAFDNFQFNTSLEAVRDFTWHSLADDYIEVVKYRLQSSTPSQDSRNAKYCLTRALITICKLLAPICPHITEAIYQEIKTKTDKKSVHMEEWPRPNLRLLDEKRIRDGKLIIEVIASARRKKSEKGLSLKTPLRQLIVSSEQPAIELLRDNQEPILRTIRAESIKLETKTSREQAPGMGAFDVNVEIVP